MSASIPNFLSQEELQQRLPTRSSLVGTELTTSEIESILHVPSQHIINKGNDLLNWSPTDVDNFSGRSRRRRASTTSISGDFMDTTIPPSRWSVVKRSIFGSTQTNERSYLYVRYKKILNKALSNSKIKIDRMEKHRRSLENKSNKRLYNLYQVGITGPLLSPFKEASQLEIACVDVRIQRECRLCGLLVDQITLCDTTTQDSFDAAKSKHSMADKEKKQNTNHDNHATTIEDTFFRLPPRLLLDDGVGATLMDKAVTLENELIQARELCTVLTNEYVIDRSQAHRGQQLLSVLPLHTTKKSASSPNPSSTSSLPTSSASPTPSSSSSSSSLSFILNTKYACNTTDPFDIQEWHQEWHQAVFESVAVDQRTREGRLLHTFFTQHLAQKMKQYQIFGNDCLPPPSTLLAFCTYLYQIITAAYVDVLDKNLEGDRERQLKRLIQRVVFQRANPLCEKYYTENVQRRAKEWKIVIEKAKMNLSLKELGAKEKFIPKEKKVLVKQEKEHRLKEVTLNNALNNALNDELNNESRLVVLETKSIAQKHRLNEILNQFEGLSNISTKGTNTSSIKIDDKRNDNTTTTTTTTTDNNNNNNTITDPYNRAVLAFHSIFVPWPKSPMDMTDKMLAYIRILHECAADVSGGIEPGGLDDLFPLLIWTISRSTSIEISLGVHRGLACLEMFVEDVSGESAFYLCAIMSAVEYLMRSLGVSDEEQERGRRESMKPVQMSLRFNSTCNKKAILELRSFLTHVDTQEDLVDTII